MTRASEQLSLLPQMDREIRLLSVRSALADADLDALLVTKLVNLRWLTGFRGSAGYALVTPDRLLVITDGRYRDQVHTELADARVDAEVEVAGSPSSLLGRAASGMDRIGLEGDHITWSAAQFATDEWFAGSEVVATRSLIEEIRAVKEPAEVARIEAAALLADAALAEMTPHLAVGLSEVEVAVGLESAMRRLGAEGPAFDTIVASGPNSAVPHHQPTPRRFESGDLVVIDMGATVDGYRSDMTRTFAIGAPDPQAVRMLEVVTAAQAAGVASAAAGTSCREVDAAARAVIAEAGWAEAFLHPTGHGVGLEIHEPLRLSATSDATLTAGHVVTVEPGVYLPGVGGVRVEDTVEVTAHGCRRLTRSPLSTAVG